MAGVWKVSGTVYDTNGTTALQSVLAVAKNINNDEYSDVTLTNSNGYYEIDLANLASGYSNGDLIEVYYYIDKKYFIHRTVINTAISGETKNITLTAITYTDPTAIANQLGVKFTMSTKPNIVRVSDLINRAEDEVDDITGHAWRTRYSGTVSGKDTSANYEYYPIEFRFRYQTGIPVYLKHRMVKSLSSASGDALELWNGSSWEDWLSTKTEGRANDYWVEYNEGILFIRTFTIWRNRPLGARVKYRYGESNVNKVIEDITTKMVLIDLLMTEDRSILLPEGTTNISIESKIENWKEEIDRKLNKFKEYKILGVRI